MRKFCLLCSLALVETALVAGCGNNPSSGVDGGGSDGSGGKDSGGGKDGGGGKDSDAGGIGDLALLGDAAAHDLAGPAGDLGGTITADLSTAGSADLLTSFAPDLLTSSAADLVAVVVPDLITAGIDIAAAPDLIVATGNDLSTGADLATGAGSDLAMSTSGDLASAGSDDLATSTGDDLAISANGDLAMGGGGDFASGGGADQFMTMISLDLASAASDAAVAIGDLAAAPLDAGPPVMLTITTAGVGTGTVTSSAGGIVCNANAGTCTAHVPAGAMLTLTAAADPGFTFAGWKGGGCSGAGSTCQLTPSADTAVAAGFAGVYYWNGMSSFSIGLGGQLKASLPTPITGPAPNSFTGVSADGMSLAYTYSGSTTSDLYVYDLWTGVATNTTGYTTASAYNYLPRFSPDGAYVYYVSNEDTSDLAGGVDVVSSATNIWRAKVDGTGRIPITSLQRQELQSEANISGAPVQQTYTLSSDGARICYVAHNATAADTGAATVYDNVYVAAADGSAPTRVTAFNSITIATDPTVGSAAISPDGTKVAFVSYQIPGTSRTGDPDSQQVSNLWTVDVATQALYSVTTYSTDYAIGEVLWNPAGTKIIFTAQRLASGAQTSNFGINLWSINPDGTGEVALAPGGDSVLNGAALYYSDESTLVYESNADTTDPTMVRSSSGYDIWTVDPVSGANTDITNEAAFDYTPIDNAD